MMKNRISDLAEETQKVRHSVDGARGMIEQLQKETLAERDKVVGEYSAGDGNLSREALNTNRREMKDKHLWKAIREEIGSMR